GLARNLTQAPRQEPSMGAASECPVRRGGNLIESNDGRGFQKMGGTGFIPSARLLAGCRVTFCGCGLCCERVAGSCRQISERPEMLANKREQIATRCDMKMATWKVAQPSFRFDFQSGGS